MLNYQRVDLASLGRPVDTQPAGHHGADISPSSPQGRGGFEDDVRQFSASMIRVAQFNGI